MTDTQQLNDIALKVGRLEVLQEANAKAVTDLANGINRLIDKLDQSDKIAREADQRVRSAQHQIDETKKELDKLSTKQADGHKFLVGTAISLGGFFIAAVTLAIKFIGP